MTSKAKHRQIGEHQGLERFLVATGLNTFGDVISTIALPIIAFQVLGGSVFEVAALVAVEQVAWLLFGLPVGVWVDRFSRKHVLVLGGVLRATLLGLIPLSWSTGWLDMSLLFFVAFTTGIVAVFTTVASGAYLPSLVPREKLLFANSKLSIVSTATETAGQVVAGLIVSVIRAPSAIIIEILCALGASCMIASTREDSRIADNNGTPTNFRRELKEGISYTFAHPLFRTILTTNVMWNVAMAGQFAIAVPFLLDSIGIDAFMIGIVFALGGVGGLVGALVVTPFSNKFGSGFVWRSALILGPILGLLVPMSCFSPGVFGATLFGVGSAVLGAAIALVSVITATARQTACPPEMLGRLGAVSQFITWSAIPLSALIFGAVGSLFGLPFAMWLVAATFFACPLIARSSPLWRAVNIATVVA